MTWLNIHVWGIIITCNILIVKHFFVTVCTFKTLGFRHILTGITVLIFVLDFIKAVFEVDLNKDQREQNLYSNLSTSSGNKSMDFFTVQIEWLFSHYNKKSWDKNILFWSLPWPTHIAKIIIPLRYQVHFSLYCFE